MEKTTIANRFTLHHKIGAGSFGEIYAAEDLITHQMVAIKLESANMQLPQLKHEARFYHMMETGVNIPSLYFYGTDQKYNIMAIELLGKSLEDILLSGTPIKGSPQPVPYSLKTALMIFDQMLQSVEYIHRNHYIHRDIKPDNFVIGNSSSENKNKLYIIDFGLSKKYRDPATLKHIEYSDNKSLTGTARYASINAMRGVEQSRRDDLESLGYVIIYLLKGKLPWQGLPARDNTTKMKKILDTKRKTSIDDLCKGLPRQFADYLKMVRNLGFEEEPKYSDYKEMFRQLFISLGYVYDYRYDWLEPRPPIEPKKNNPRHITNGKSNQKHYQRRLSNLPKNQSPRRIDNQVMNPITNNNPLLGRTNRTEVRQKTAIPGQRYHNNPALAPKINRPQIPPRVYPSRRAVPLAE